jgi:hypothetical protein
VQVNELVKGAFLWTHNAGTNSAKVYAAFAYDCEGQDATTTRGPRKSGISTRMTVMDSIVEE